MPRLTEKTWVSSSTCISVERPVTTRYRVGRVVPCWTLRNNREEGRSSVREEAGEGKGGGVERGMNLGGGLDEGSTRLAGVIGGVKGCELRMACLEGGGEARSSELTFGRISISRIASAWYICGRCR
jgi:hypothetical protein